VGSGLPANIGSERGTQCMAEPRLYPSNELGERSRQGVVVNHCFPRRYSQIRQQPDRSYDKKDIDPAALWQQAVESMDQ
jgi:hypothetical protein